MTKVNLIAFACAAFLCFAAPSCFLLDQYPTCPTSFEGEDARDKFTSLRKSLLVHGISFFNEKIYLSTSRAILEFTGERLDRLYKCRRANGDYSQVVGVDQVSRKLWFYDYRNLQLLHFDGAKWSSQDLPSLPKPDYYSRGDVSAGFRGFNHAGKFLLLNTHRFTLPNVHRAWTNEGDGTWTAFEMPTMRCNLGNAERSVEKGCLREVGPIGDELCAVLNGDLIGQTVADGGTFHEDNPPPEPDIVACMRGNLWRVVNSEKTPEFFSDKVVSRYNAMYTSTRAGNIFRITTAGPESIPTLGEVDAIAISSEGNLLVWFSRQGIYEWRGEWKKLYDVPFEPASDLQGKLIEESGGTIVVTASPPWKSDQKPQPDQAWIMKDGRVVQIL